MCGRIIIPDESKISYGLQLKLSTNGTVPENKNVPPTRPVPVMADNHPDELQYFRWSLIPWWAKEVPKFSTFNAKVENLHTSGTWRHLIGKKHCVIITDGFYEWQKMEDKKAKKQPHLIRTHGEQFTLMAGLWDEWTDKGTGEVITSCTIITKSPNQQMKGIHDRMPAIVTLEQAKIWVNDSVSLKSRMLLLNNIPNNRLKAVPIERVGEIEKYAEMFTYC